MIRSGVDIIAIARVEDSVTRLGEAFLRRIYTEAEQKYCGSRNAKAMESYAGRFAAKEAVAKALGTGIGISGVAFTEMEVLPDGNGMPVVTLSGHAKAVFEELGGKSISISISHDNGCAVAFCCLECQDKE